MEYALNITNELLTIRPDITRIQDNKEIFMGQFFAKNIPTPKLILNKQYETNPVKEDLPKLVSNLSIACTIPT